MLTQRKGWTSLGSCLWQWPDNLQESHRRKQALFPDSSSSQSEYFQLWHLFWQDEKGWLKEKVWQGEERGFLFKVLAGFHFLIWCQIQHRYLPNALAVGLVQRLYSFAPLSLSVSCCSDSLGVSGISLVLSLCENLASPGCRAHLQSVKERESPVHAISRTRC